MREHRERGWWLPLSDGATADDSAQLKSIIDTHRAMGTVTLRLSA